MSDWLYQNFFYPDKKITPPTEKELRWGLKLFDISNKAVDFQFADRDPFVIDYNKNFSLQTYINILDQIETVQFYFLEELKEQEIDLNQQFFTSQYQSYEIRTDKKKIIEFLFENNEKIQRLRNFGVELLLLFNGCLVDSPGYRITEINQDNRFFQYESGRINNHRYLDFSDLYVWALSHGYQGPQKKSDRAKIIDYTLSIQRKLINSLQQFKYLDSINDQFVDLLV